MLMELQINKPYQLKQEEFLKQIAENVKQNQYKSLVMIKTFLRYKLSYFQVFNL